MKFEKSTDEGENPRAYKKRHSRELDALFRANGVVQSQDKGTPEYDRGWTWNFVWCSDDPTKARPKLVARVQTLMGDGFSFEESFDYARENAALIESL